MSPKCAPSPTPELRVLGIDVCTGFCAAAVVDGDAVCASLSEAMTRGHVERLAPMVEDVLAAAALSFNDLQAIAVTTGPGSFTGARLGVSFARGLALSLGIPAVGVTVFEAMAARETDPLFVALDGKRSMVFAQGFDRGVPTSDPTELPVADAWRSAPPGEFRLIGSGRDAMLAAAPDDIRARAVLLDPKPVLPETVAHIAVAKLTAGTDIRPAPLYLRAPDAKVQAGVSLNG